MSVAPRLALPLLLLVPVACQQPGVRALQDPGMRAELGDRVCRTLERQEHYFRDAEDAASFRTRLRALASKCEDAGTYYRAVADALASLAEGHTALVASPEVPFTDTIPPVAILEAEGQPTVAGVAPGVEGGGLRPGDVILEVDGRSVAEHLAERLEVTPASTNHARRARAVAHLLAGPTHEPARVRVRGADGRERRCFPLRFLLVGGDEDLFRFGFLPHHVRAGRLGPGVVHLSLPDFREERLEETERALGALGETETLVLDLRGNPGGRVETMQRIAGLFLDEGLVIAQYVDGDRTAPVRALGAAVFFRGRLLVLVDERTGSAAEILAAALQDHGRARLFGRRTAGSTRARRSALLPGRVVFHYAGRAEFTRRNGRSVEGEGVEPDVIVQHSRACLAQGSYGSAEFDPALRVALGLN